MAHLFNKLKVKAPLRVSVRHAHKANDESRFKKKKLSTDRALEFFDDLYAKVYGEKWKSIRTALLAEKNKHVAIVNNFSDKERILSTMESYGALNVRSMFDVYLIDIKKRDAKFEKKQKYKKNMKSNESMDTARDDAQESTVQSVYKEEDKFDSTSLSAKKEGEERIVTDEPFTPVELKSIENDLNRVDTDTNRIVHPSGDLSGLHEFVPATQLLGLDDWVLESKYYEQYNREAEFTVITEKEDVLSFPEHLNAFTFETDPDERFPSPKSGSTGVLDYFLFDGCSLLPVLALDVQGGDTVLDMCAAPGGKALTVLQTLMPGVLVANDISQSRIHRMNKVFQEYLFEMKYWHDKLFITKHDARLIDDKDLYDKILVDAPCTTDRHVLHVDENNIFRPDRIKERLTLPELQTEILTNALKLIKVGGTVVYSTCSLNPIQNDGVVHMALKKAWEETGFTIIVKDMSKALRPLKALYEFYSVKLKHGHMAVPTLTHNWGPMYFCKMVRRQ